MAIIYIKSEQKSQEMISLVKSAVESEIARLELALQMAEHRLMPFEQKYKVSSDYFIQNMFAEELTGSDDEYIQWAGEYKLKQRLHEKLQQLREIRYGD